MNKQRGSSNPAFALPVCYVIGRHADRSSVFRLWQKVGQEKSAEIRRRPLDVNGSVKSRDWSALMVAGASLARDLLAVVAKILKRGVAPSMDNPRSLLAVLDGSVALRKAVSEHFADASIQRCLVHSTQGIPT